MAVRCVCPGCGAACAVPAEQVGRAFTCPHCSRPFVAAPTAPAATPAKSGRPSPLVWILAGVGLVGLMLLGCCGVTVAWFVSRQHALPDAGSASTPRPTELDLPNPAPPKPAAPEPKPPPRRDRPLADLVPPEPEDTAGSLTTPRETLTKEIKVMPLNLPAGKLVGGLVWDAKAEHFFCLEEGGLLRRVAYRELRERRRLELGRKCSALSVSAAGLVVTLPELQEVWVIDPDELAVRGRLGVADVTAAVSAPPLSVGVARHADGALSVLDLAAKAVVPAENAEGSLPAFAPDGRHLFAEKGGRLQRFRLDGDRLVFEQSTPAIVRGKPIAVCVSPDGRFVALPSAGGSARGVPGHPQTGPNGIYVYAANNLNRPAVVVNAVSPPRALGFDAKTNEVYAAADGRPLVRYGPRGVRLREYTFGPRGPVEVRQYLAHPTGRKVLIHTATDVYAVEILGR